MPEVSPGQLQAAVEGLHGGKATLSAVVEIHERFEGEPVFDGLVHVFDLSGHPTATRAYAWSSPVDGTDRGKFYAVLHQPPISSPSEAVRAVIVSGG